MLVSIIMPAHNSEGFIKESIRSVQQQTFHDWELIIVDDASTDGTAGAVRALAQTDGRIKLLVLDSNQGPSTARQYATKVARGQYIAFLDSDDLWYPNKLRYQLAFMKEQGCAISCTAYEQIDEDGNYIGKTIRPPQRADYNRVLLSCPVGNSTVVYDTMKLGKCYAPDIKNREDYALWLKILKKEKYIFGISSILTKYRVRKDSQSRNKLKLIKYHWILYRDFEHLSFLRSVFHIVIWGFIKLLRIK